MAVIPGGARVPMTKLAANLRQQTIDIIEREILILMVEEKIMWEWVNKHSSVGITKEESKAFDTLHAAQCSEGVKAWAESGLPLLNYHVYGDLAERGDIDGNHTIGEELCKTFQELVKRKEVHIEYEMGACYIHSTKEHVKTLEDWINAKEHLGGITFVYDENLGVDQLPISRFNTWTSAVKELYERFNISEESLKPFLLQKYGIVRQFTTWDLGL